MSNATLQPQLRSIRDIFRTTLLEVPRYQRPYSWTPENVQEFLDDVADKDAAEGYFIGPMVIYRNGPRHAIVDGQQRLTTIVLILVVLREYLSSFGRDDLAAGIQNFIETKDEENQTHYVFVSHAAGTHLFENYLQMARVPQRSAVNEDQRNIDAAAKDVRAQLAQRLDDLDTEGLSDAQIIDVKTQYLNDLRARVLGLNVIWFPLDSEEQAYAIFETLNSRGKDLDTVDLLKNLILSGLPPENADHDSSAENWRELRRILEEDGKSASPNMFIHHWWISRAPYVPERRVYRSIRSQVSASNMAHKELLDELLRDAALYAKIANPAGATWTREQGAVRDSLQALQVFGVRQPRPLLLAALRSHRDKKITLRQLKMLIGAIEGFHYVTTAVMRLSSSGGVSQMYAAYAKRLTEAPSKDQAGKLITDIRAALRGKIPGEGFEAAFAERLRYSNAEVDQKELVFYTLRKMQRILRPNHPLEHAACNVEHLEPQSGSEPWVAEIGNLVWMPEKLNDRLAAKDFTSKQAILKQFENQLILDGVLEVDDWGQEQTRARSEMLARLALEEVWKT